MKQITKQDNIAEHKPRPNMNNYVYAGSLSVLGLAIGRYLLYSKFKKQKQNLHPFSIKCREPSHGSCTDAMA